MFAGHRALLLAVPLFVLGCATAPAAGGGARGNPDIITRAELDGVSGNAYDAINTLRPAFLRERGVQSVVNDPGADRRAEVWVEGARFGDASSLRSIDTGSILEIRYYSPNDAASRFRASARNGVIAITMKQ